MPLEKELAFFESQAMQLRADHLGQFALVHGEALLGVYPTFGQAFEAGLKAVGNRPFLVKEIAEHETTVQHPALTVGLTSARS